MLAIFEMRRTKAKKAPNLRAGESLNGSVRLTFV
jgi:hypothetical protein